MQEEGFAAKERELAIRRNELALMEHWVQNWVSYLERDLRHADNVVKKAKVEGELDAVRKFRSELATRRVRLRSDATGGDDIVY